MYMSMTNMTQTPPYFNEIIKGVYLVALNVLGGWIYIMSCLC